jgi:hypothetical protein
MAMASKSTLELRRSVAREKGYPILVNDEKSRQSGRIPLRYASESRQIHEMRVGKEKGPKNARNKAKAH